MSARIYKATYNCDMLKWKEINEKGGQNNMTPIPRLKEYKTGAWQIRRNRDNRDEESYPSTPSTTTHHPQFATPDSHSGTFLNPLHNTATL